MTYVTTLTPLLRSKTRAQQLKEIEKDIDIIQVLFVDLQSLLLFSSASPSIGGVCHDCQLFYTPTNPRSLHFSMLLLCHRSLSLCFPSLRPFVFGTRLRPVMPTKWLSNSIPSMQFRHLPDLQNCNCGRMTCMFQIQSLLSINLIISSSLINSLLHAIPWNFALIARLDAGADRPICG